MPKSSSFTDSEIELIKHKINHKFESSMIIAVLASPIICLIMPYIPGRRGRVPMIDEMPYWDAVWRMSIIWILVLIGVWFRNYFKTRNQFSASRKYLRRKNKRGVAIGKSKSLFSRFDNKLSTNIEGKLKEIKIEKEESQSLKVGDKIEIEFEEHTMTIFKIEKYQ